MIISVPTNRTRHLQGFTLVELLVCLAVVAILAGLLLPALASAKNKAKRVVCLSNLKQTGQAIHTFAGDNEGKIPYGPVAPPFTSPANFYPSTGAPTSLLSLQSGSPVGLGLLLKDHLGGASKVLFCPGTDQPIDTDAELAKVGHTQAQGSYFYRHAGITQLFYTPPEPVPHLQLDDLGTNRLGQPIRALAIDSLFLPPEGLESFNVKPRTHHRLETANVLFADGHVGLRDNAQSRFTVDVSGGDIHQAFSKILKALEQADAEP